MHLTPKYWRNKISSNCQMKCSLCTNYDSFIPLSFIHFVIRHNLKWTLRQTSEIFGVFEILFFLMYCRMVLTVVCYRFRMLFDADGRLSTLTNVTFYAKMLIQSDRSVNEFGLNEMNVFLR